MTIRCSARRCAAPSALPGPIFPSRKSGLCGAPNRRWRGETVSRWWSAYAHGGLDALPDERTGRPVGSGRTLTDEQSAPIQELLDNKMRDAGDLQRFVLSYLVMHLLTTQDPGLMQIFDALHFPITSTKSPQFGELPITRIGLPVTTTRPSDAVVIESAELTGMDAFEEVVNIEDLKRLADPFRDRLLDIARQQMPELV